MGFLTLRPESWVCVTVPELKRAWRLQFTEENNETTEEREKENWKQTLAVSSAGSVMGFGLSDNNDDSNNCVRGCAWLH